MAEVPDGATILPMRVKIFSFDADEFSKLREGWLPLFQCFYSDRCCFNELMFWNKMHDF